MKSTFSVGLLEVFAYLVPGLIVILAIVYKYTGVDLYGDKPHTYTVLAVLTIGYVTGHLLTLGSQLFVELRGLLKNITGVETREKRYGFYPELEKLLNSYFGYCLSRSDQYLFSVRIVAEYCSESNKAVERLYGLTLFCRNTVLALIVSSIFTFGVSPYISLGLILVAVVFFWRYTQFEKILEGSVYRSAFLWLITNGKSD